MESDFNELGLSETAMQRLDALKVRTVREFLLVAYLPEQHDLLAAHLGVDVETLRDVVKRAASTIPSEELTALVERARRAQQIPPGALPPGE